LTEPRTSEPAVEGALAGLRVLELGSMLAGPFVGTMLGDFGAEVIKVEKPGEPDALRQWPPHKGDEPLWWKCMARNKRTVTLDLKPGPARAHVLALMERSDVVVENFRPGTLERWGLGPDELAERFPRLVWVRVSGYGQSGPYRERGGYATIAEAFSGLASFTGYADRGPMVSAFPLGDYLAGLFGAFGALAALRRRDSCGRGQIVDVSLFEPLLRIIEAAVMRYDQLGESKPRLGNQMEEDIPRNVYRAADGVHIAISCGSQRVFEGLTRAMARPELARDPHFATMQRRAENRAAIDGAVAEWIAARPGAEALARLEAERVVAGRVNDIADVLADAHCLARAAFLQVEDDALGPVTMPAPTPKLSATPGAVRWTGRAPGADNAYVFGDLLGLGADTLAALRDTGAI
jgi:crotonobetainyl-CoA:carnitine CoA-transferase CaiB-like acyl-CoA transferase